MHLSRHTRSLSFALAAGSVPLLLALSLHGQPVPKVMPLKAGSPLSVAQALDEIIQPRFQEDAANFGISRVLTINGHESVARFMPRNLGETNLLGRAQAANLDYVISFLHCAHVPGHSAQFDKFPQPQRRFLSLASDMSIPHPSLTLLEVRQEKNMTPDTPADLKWEADTAEPYYNHLRQSLEKPVVESLPLLKTHRDAETRDGDWVILLRPVRASKDSCLTCHVGAKRGDTLGVMVYAVSNTANKN